MTERQWSKHFRDSWELRSGDARLPGWLRVASLAYGSHAANGHATFRPSSRTTAGDIAVVLGSVDTGTGEVVAAASERVRLAIDAAVEYGWLRPGSCASCLIVAGHDVRYDVGSPFQPCKIDHTRANVKHTRQALARGGFRQAT